MEVKQQSSAAGEYKRGLYHGASIGLGYFAVSAAFGMLAVSCGLSPGLALLISVTNLTSAGQFAGLALIGAGGSLIEIAATVFVINIRYVLMSLSLSQKLSGLVKFWQRFIIAHGVTDEIFMVASLQEGEITFRYMLGLMTLPILGWGGGTYLGAVATELLPAIVQDGLGIALYGMFIALIIPAVRKSLEILAVVAVAVALSCLFFYLPALSGVSTGVAVFVCTVVGAGFGAYFFPNKGW